MLRERGKGSSTIPPTLYNRPQEEKAGYKERGLLDYVPHLRSHREREYRRNVPRR
jgi:hypothetical protein